MPVRSSHLAGGVPPASRGPTIANRECAPCLILSAAECGTRGYTAAYISMSDTRYTFTPAGCSHNGTKIDPDTHYRFALRSPRPLALLRGTVPTTISRAAQESSTARRGPISRACSPLLCTIRPRKWCHRLSVMPSSVYVSLILNTALPCTHRPHRPRMVGRSILRPFGSSRDRWRDFA